MSLTTDPKDPRLIEGQKNETGQHEIYLVLSEEERAKGFVRPVRNSYVHIGKKVELDGGKVRRLSQKQKDKYKDYGYYAYIKFPPDRSPLAGRYLTEKEYNNIGKYIGGCGGITTMGMALSETYARNPKFYGATYCCTCMKHLPVDEFVWNGTNEKVGS